MPVLVAGTIAIDDVKTPAAEHRNLLGGSASYASIASSFYAPTRLLGVIGNDFPEEHLKTLHGFGIDTAGVETADGETFRWSGEYFDDLNTRETKEVLLNVIEHYQPKLPASYQDASQVVLLANMSPETQGAVLDQMPDPAFVIADTMDLWIQAFRDPLDTLLKRIDLLVLNDSEAKMYMETNNLIKAGEMLRGRGPRYVVIKKGEHGALLFGDNTFFTSSAYPLPEVHDPTGAGDTFVGAMAGFLAERNSYGMGDLAGAIVEGTVVASYNCESFSTRKLEEVSSDDIAARKAELAGFSRWPEG